MEITAENNNNTLEIKVTGRLDILTAPRLDKFIKLHAKNINLLVLDLSGIEYISSMGMRTDLFSHKLMTSISGKLIIRKPSPFCMQVFEEIGIAGSLNIEQ